MTTTVEDARRRPVLLTLLVVYVLFLATVLLFPRGELPSTSVSVLTDLVQRLGADPVLVTSSRVEVISNVLIMVPLALLGRLVRRGYSWRDWTAVGFVMATGVELFQGLFLPDRSASALDVVANTTGVAVGAVIGSLMRWFIVRRDGRSA
ncbi:VanZ family protein [Nocardioides sp. CFH 31398]|uniref:VanZ family protein n=1 Tax=Nocardioides sp. CFH 31398 TaxID=2919579 RepID=UPI001F06866D|nr:VanZ family protein [Nocardioides sp. CFH 31398]MCH1866009.1 VanZ family protein [Nocardioides sp. CFH 31398]